MIGPPFVFLSTLSLRRATRYGRPIDVQLVFLSTLSLRRATVTVLGVQHRIGISIHALLAESDPARRKHDPKRNNFYPRSPCGERQFLTCIFPVIDGFLSTLSLRRATHALLQGHFIVTISIHALLAESDCLACLLGIG